MKLTTELWLHYAIKLLLRPMYLARYFKVGICISVQNEHNRASIRHMNDLMMTS